MAQFLQYWEPAQVDYDMSVEELLLHSGSEQLYRVQAGDTVWIVTVRPPGNLFVVGRLQIGERISYEEAKRRFSSNVWKAKYHIVAESGTEEELREVSLMDIAESLRFQSSTKRDRLTLSNGRVKAQQLQAMRRLTASSVALLQAKWYATESLATSEIEQQIKSGAGFGNPDTNRKVERAAITFVSDWYQRNGWIIKSVESKKRGYDLICSKGADEEHVEVKGIQGTELSFIITSNEVRQAHTNPAFVLCAVNSALSDNPRMSRYKGEEFIDKFKLDELAYRASLRT
ncbi:MAG TPA: DUF3883 domain-containing protein [Pyrinomonadaceae bacterium]|jgi:hypothetical protein